MAMPSKADVRADPNVLFANKPASPVGDSSVEVCVVGKRCVYINDYRIAGGKPYGSENLPQHMLVTTLKEVLAAFSHDEILAALAEGKAEREYFAAFHAQLETPA